MITNRVEPRDAVLAGDLRVKRILPLRGGKMVGPFAFLDQMGPITVGPGHGGDVPPHPHIGLSTLTYLESGELLHRDSLGSVQTIRPGEANWMTSGSGIVHSERIPPESREKGGEFYGLQAWIALPKAQEESDPHFQHVDATAIPEFEVEGCRIRLIAGTAFGRTSPVDVHSRLFYFRAQMPAGREISFHPEGQAAALYLSRGKIAVEGQDIASPTLVEFHPDAEIRVSATSDAEVYFLGGEVFPEPRYIWWNFVSSSRERIEQAKEQWRRQEFARVPGETEYVPLPEKPAAEEKTRLP